MIKCWSSCLVYHANTIAKYIKLKYSKNLQSKMNGKIQKVLKWYDMCTTNQQGIIVYTVACHCDPGDCDLSDNAAGV